MAARPVADLLQEKGWTRSTVLAILVSGLGYFVDIYDLILFGIVRVDSLKSIGLTGEAITQEGIFLLNMQMIGMLVGGLFWGILGDKKGRLSVLFISIIMYSVANIANAFVLDVVSYAEWRFIAGVGLAGELGAGITLVSESMPKESRGWGTTIVATLGLWGAVVAGSVANMDWNALFPSLLSHWNLENWRIAYLFGGMLGLLLLVLRIGVHESGMFQKMVQSNVSKGNVLLLFRDWKTTRKFLATTLIGVPIWYSVGILVLFSLELNQFIHVQGEINMGKAVALAYVGIAIGDFISGALSQILRSRKKAIFLFMTFLCLICYYYLYLMKAPSIEWFYTICFLIGFATGYWAVFVTTAAEQFGTNIRATVTTSTPNFVRGSVALITSLFEFLRHRINDIHAAALVGAICFLAAYWALFTLQETYGKELDYLES
jgi:MFS family permease